MSSSQLGHCLPFSSKLRSESRSSSHSKIAASLPLVLSLPQRVDGMPAHGWSDNPARSKPPAKQPELSVAFAAAPCSGVETKLRLSTRGQVVSPFNDSKVICASLIASDKRGSGLIFS